MGPGHVSFSAYQFIHQQENSADPLIFSFPEFLLGFSYIDLVDGNIGHMIELSL